MSLRGQSQQRCSCKLLSPWLDTEREQSSACRQHRRGQCGSADAMTAAISRTALFSQECCAPLCGNGAQVVCPAGTAVKPEDVNKTSDGGVEAPDRHSTWHRFSVVSCRCISFCILVKCRGAARSSANPMSAAMAGRATSRRPSVSSPAEVEVCSGVFLYRLIPVRFRLVHSVENKTHLPRVSFLYALLHDAGCSSCTATVRIP